MTAIGSGVKGLVARAQREAQRRGQTPATAHLLLVMLQTGGVVGRLLGSLSVRESDLLSAIRVVDPEPSSALERGDGKRLPAGEIDGRSRGHTRALAVGRRARWTKHSPSKPTEIGHQSHTSPAASDGSVGVFRSIQALAAFSAAYE